MNDPQDAEDVVTALRSEVAELKDLMRDLIAAVAKVETSTTDSATKIVAAIQRWT